VFLSEQYAITKVTTSVQSVYFGLHKSPQLWLHSKKYGADFLNQNATFFALNHFC